MKLQVLYTGDGRIVSLSHAGGPRGASLDGDVDSRTDARLRSGVRAGAGQRVATVEIDEADSAVRGLSIGQIHERCVVEGHGETAKLVARQGGARSR